MMSPSSTGSPLRTRPPSSAAAKAAEARKVRKTAAELRYGGGEKQKEALEHFGIKRPLRYLLFPGRNQNALQHWWFKKTGPEHSGLYKLRLQASGSRPPGGQPAHLSIGKKTSEETVDGLIEFDVTAPEDSPQVYEMEVFLEMPTGLHLRTAVRPFFSTPTLHRCSTTRETASSPR